MAANYGYIFAIAFLLAISFSAVNASLKCWQCSSDATNGAFCADPFDPYIMTEDQRYRTYRNCTVAFGSRGPYNARPVCKKVVQEIYGKIVISRSCHSQDIDDPTDKCSRDNQISYIRNLACDTCTTDGCNGAAGFAPIAAMIIMPVALAKMLIL